jgi:hypothetical protein
MLAHTQEIPTLQLGAVVNGALHCLSFYVRFLMFFTDHRYWTDVYNPLKSDEPIVTESVQSIKEVVGRNVQLVTMFQKGISIFEGAFKNTSTRNTDNSDHILYRNYWL